MRYEFEYKRYSSLGELGASDRELVDVAFGVTRSAHAPYSGFRVAAVARLESGRIISATNQESEVYPSGMCAERVLLYGWQTAQSSDPIETLVIASDPSERECTPCGACRQVMLDSERRQGRPMRVLMCGGGTVTEVASAELLLPFSFRL